MSTGITASITYTNEALEKIVGEDIGNLKKRGIKTVVFVHQNPSEKIYDWAEQGLISLVYSTKPTGTALAGGDSLMMVEDAAEQLGPEYADEIIESSFPENRFETKGYLKWLFGENLLQKVRERLGLPLDRERLEKLYLVPQEKAKSLRKMILEEKKPMEIADYLGEENLITSQKKLEKKLKNYHA